LGFLLAIALPASTTDTWLAEFTGALGDDAKAFGCPLLGGDTDRTPGPLSVSISAFGTVPHGRMVRRDGARAGDRIFVSGTIGDAALGLALRRDGEVGARWGLNPDERAHLLARYALPQPRLALISALRDHASAAMDISDGLAGDLAKLARVSGIRAVVDFARIPLAEGAGRALSVDPLLVSAVLGGGDDYEILATIPADRVEPFRAAASTAGVSVTEIGAVITGAGTEIRGRDGKPVQLDRPAYSHF
jgi:thiamine-monophosphate kinase